MGGLAVGSPPEIGRRVARALGVERRLLLDYVASLPEAEWKGETLCSEWDVRDVAAHMLGTDEDSLSMRTVLRVRRAAKRGREAFVRALAEGNEAQQRRHAADTPAHLTAALERTGRKLERRLARMPAPMWRMTIPTSGTTMTMSEAMSGILLNAWVHRRDIQVPRGVPRTDDREQLALLVPWALRGSFVLADFRPAAPVNLDLGWGGVWHVSPGAHGFSAGESPAAKATIAVEPGEYVMLATGRTTSMKDAGATVSGDAAAADEFAREIRYLGTAPGI